MKGYTLEGKVIEEHTTISEATEVVYKYIKRKLDRHVTQICCVKINIRTMSSVIFPSTWDTSDIERVYSGNKQEYPHMMAVAVVTDSCVRHYCKKNGSIANAEEYVITLKQRLIEERWKNFAFVNGETDVTDGGVSDAYVLCVAFKQEGKCYVLVHL